MSPAGDHVELVFSRRPSAAAYMVRAALPVSRRRDAVPSIVARWRGHRVDLGALDAFLRITGAPRGGALPLLYPHVFGFRLPMAILTHPAFPVPIWGVLQTRNRIVQHLPIPIDARLDLEARLSEARGVEKGVEYDLATTVRASGALCWESVVTFYARGRFRASEAPVAPPRAPAESGPEIDRWTMRDDAHVRFGRFTGDYNGIHLWDRYARRFGFAGALYHPPRVLAESLARLSSAAPKVQLDPPVRVEVWLKGPVRHGATVRLHAAREDAATTFAVFAGEDRPSIVGRIAR